MVTNSVNGCDGGGRSTPTGVLPGGEVEHIDGLCFHPINPLPVYGGS